MSPHQHLRALIDELRDSMAIAATTSKRWRLLKLLQSNLQTILNPPPSMDTPRTEQRVSAEQQRVREEQQRVINDTPIRTIPRITNAPPIMQARNPMAKRALKSTKRIHQRQMQANTPGSVPMTTQTNPIPAIGAEQPARCIRKLQDVLASSQRMTRAQNAATSPPTTRGTMPTWAQHRRMSQQAMNVLTLREQATFQQIFTPKALVKYARIQVVHKFDHYANPMVHPVTGKTILSCKKLTNHSTTAKVWQTAFGNDCG